MKNVFNKKKINLFFGPFDEYNILILQRYCLQVNMSFVPKHGSLGLGSTKQ